MTETTLNRGVLMYSTIGMLPLEKMLMCSCYFRKCKFVLSFNSKLKICCLWESQFVWIYIMFPYYDNEMMKNNEELIINNNYTCMYAAINISKTI